MKRKKWYKYKNSETGHVIHSPILPEDMTFSEGDTYYAYETNPARARVLDGRGAFDFHAEKEKKR